MREALGTDADSWQVRLLPHPKRFTRSTALGFCGGRPVGMAETARGKAQSCWWPVDEAELISLEGYKELQARCARGDCIAGAWSKGSGRSTGAAVWRMRDSKLDGSDLHDRRFEKTWAECAEHGLVLGVGVHKGRLGARPPDCGLVWREDGTCQEVNAPGDVCLKGTDGMRLVGSADGRAALWPNPSAAPLDLGPAGFGASECYGLDGDTQVGVAFKGLTARAVLWRGTASSFVDLTPDGFKVGRAFHAAGGWQTGLVRREDVTRNGSASLADQAALWQGSSVGWFDLNALLPPESGLNASVAWSIEWRGDRVQICGEASRYEVSDPGTDRESHFSAAAQAVVWTAHCTPQSEHRGA
jgi:hypothetical protein